MWIFNIFTLQLHYFQCTKARVLNFNFRDLKKLRIQGLITMKEFLKNNDINGGFCYHMRGH